MAFGDSTETTNVTNKPAPGTAPVTWQDGYSGQYINDKSYLEGRYERHSEVGYRDTYGIDDINVEDYNTRMAQGRDGDNSSIGALHGYSNEAGEGMTIEEYNKRVQDDLVTNANENNDPLNYDWNPVNEGPGTASSTGAPPPANYLTGMDEDGNLNDNLYLDTKNNFLNEDGSVKDQFQGTAGVVDESGWGEGYTAGQVDLEGSDGAMMYKDLAENGPAAWLEASKKGADLNRQDVLDSTNRKISSSVAGAYDMQAALGGITSGGASSYGKEGIKQSRMGQQNAYRDAINSKQGFDVKALDAQNKAKEGYAGLEGKINMFNTGEQNTAAQSLSDNFLGAALENAGNETSTSNSNALIASNIQSNLSAEDQFNIENLIGQMDGVNTNNQSIWEKLIEQYGANQLG